VPIVSKSDDPYFNGPYFKLDISEFYKKICL